MTVNMKLHLRIINTILTRILFILLLSFSNTSNAQDGKALFMKNCASCHALDKKLTGPALLGVEERWKGNRKNLTAWIKNTGSYMKTTNDPYAIALFNEYNKSAMNVFDGVIDEKEIGAILDYVKNWKPTGPVNTGGVAGEKPESDNSLLFGILTLILAVVAFTLMQVNSGLRKLADEKEGVDSPEPVAFWKNRT